MAVVNVTVTPRGVIVQPEKVVINRVDQQITWQLQGGEWASPGIVFNPPAAGYQAWPGGPAVPVGDRYIADAADPLPDGAPAERYAYTIRIKEPSSGKVITRAVAPVRGANYVANNVDQPVDDEGVLDIDPGVENQPTP